MKMLIKQRFFSWFDSYDVYDENDEVLYVCKAQFSWDYEVKDKDDNLVATINKKIWKLTDTYEIDVVNKEDCLNVLMLVLAIDIDDFRRNAS